MATICFLGSAAVLCQFMNEFPFQVIDELNVAWLQWSYENWQFQVDKPLSPKKLNTFVSVSEQKESQKALNKFCFASLSFSPVLMHWPEIYFVAGHHPNWMPFDFPFFSSLACSNKKLNCPIQLGYIHGTNTMGNGIACLSSGRKWNRMGGCYRSTF